MVASKEKNQIALLLPNWKRYKSGFLKADDNMKLHIKEQLRTNGYPGITDMKPPSQPVMTKGAPKKLKPTPNDNSTTWAPSYCEHVYKLFPGSPTPKSLKSQTSSNKGAHISKPPPTPILSKIPIIKEMPIPQKIPFIEEMPIFIHKYIERIVSVTGDCNCSYQAVLALLGNGEDGHALVRHQLIQELKTHKDSYSRSYGEEAKFEAVNGALVPWLDAYVLVSKWTRFPEMRHLIACPYDRVCIDLTCYGCPIPPTSLKWALHHSEDAETWPNLFIDRMHEFEKLNDIEKETNKEKSKLEPLIDLADDSSFDVFCSFKV
ncbi:uncharacterized protein LOC131650704 [Vicia villosa]|uniref:uncharacterized protein LOC131650704 n=1 Tax=Vicia villosa TaxID=3911 RepID=UPI00273A95F9|nr:uncharacterized protein LOC131650704 [Vicia villosa]